MKTAQLTILDNETYFREITRKITLTHSGDRVALMTMSFSTNESLIAPLLQAVTAATKRGVHVYITVDAHTFTFDNTHQLPTGPVIRRLDPSLATSIDFRTKLAALEKILRSGGHYSITNLPKGRISNPYAGRSHIKYTVINNTAYVGGCNLLGSEQIDLMVRIEDTFTANWIYDFMVNVTKTQNVRAVLEDKDISLPIDHTTTLLVDAGVPKQSLIYEQALQFIDEAQEWLVITCQFFPGKTTAEHLARAIKRGVNVHVYYNHLHHQGIMRLPHQLAEIGEKIQRPRQLFLDELPKDLTRIHAKLLASEHGAIIGSHNYVTQGVDFGTAESAVIRQDQDFAIEATTTFLKMVNVADIATVIGKKQTI